MLKRRENDVAFPLLIDKNIRNFFFILRRMSNDGDFRLRDGGFQRCQNYCDSVRMTEG